MSNYRRWRVAGGCYFFTVNLLNRRQQLLIDHIDLLRSAFRKVRDAHPFHIDAVVVLPEHLHCVLTLPDGDANYSKRWSEIKKTFSRGLTATENRSRSRIRTGERGIWQRRFWEHVIRDDSDSASHIDYIHFNPVKHKLCARPVDWPHSSIHDFIHQGILASDWGTCGSPNDLELG
ncbi:MAG TPA: transposase [Phycisphaerales bacterium]|nr:transposase [Phycisphaerales bacterium]